MRLVLAALLLVVSLVGCSRTQPQAVPVQEATPEPPQPVQVDTLTYKLIDAERLDKLNALEPKGYFVRVKYRVTNQGEPLWVTFQYSQLQTQTGTYEQDMSASYEVKEVAQRYMPQNDWNEVDVYFDVPSDEQPTQVWVKNGPDAQPAKFDLDITQ